MYNIVHSTTDRMSVMPPRERETQRTVSIDNPWVQAGFCDERGVLTFEPHFTSHFLDQAAIHRLDELLHKTVFIDRVTITIKEYLDHVIEHFSSYGFELCLRGSYAAYVYHPLETLEELVKDFIQQHPEQRDLMEEGLRRIALHFPPMPVPNDSDWTLLGSSPLNAELQQVIRSGLIEVHAALTGLSYQEAERTTFQSLFVPHSNQWTNLSDSIVISTIGGSDIKLDLVTGFLEEAPYLFSHDNRMIRIAKKPYVQVIQGNLFQSAADYGLDIIRFEERHAKDFRALLKALHHLTNGKRWDETLMTAQEIVRGFLQIPTREIAQFILKWLDGKKVDRISFVVNFLCLVEDEVQRNELWKQLSDGKVSFKEATRQIHERKRAFPEAYGAMPLLKEEPTEAPITPSQDFMKRALFLPIVPLPCEPTGIYAEWRHCCERLLNKQPVSKEFIDQISALYLANKFTKEEEATLALRMSFPTLIEALTSLGSNENVYQSWLEAHQELSWEEKLQHLGHHRNPATKSFLLKQCLTDSKAKELYLAALRQGVFQPENRSKEVFLAITGNDREDAVIAFIGKVAALVPLESKEWIIDLWIDCVKNGRISHATFNGRVPQWLNGKLPENMKERIALNIIQAFGVASLESIESLAPHIAHADAAILQDCFIKALEKSGDAAALFFRLHQNALSAYLDDLFLKAAEKQLAFPFITALKSMIDMRSLILANLAKIPTVSRLTCAQELPPSDQMQCLKEPHLLASNDRTTLGLRIVNETKSIFDLWLMQSFGIYMPERLAHSFLQSFYSRQNLKGDTVQQATAQLIGSLHIEALELIVPRLEPALKDELQPAFRKRLEQSLAQDNLDEIAAVLKCKELAEWAQVTPKELEGLKIAPEQIEKLYTIVIGIKGPSLLYFALCVHYIRLVPDAHTNIKLCNLMFSWAPHRIPAEMANHLVRALTANPQQFAKAFNAHASWLMRMIDATGETYYQLLNIYIDLKIALPEVIPQVVVEHILSIPIDQKARTLTENILRKTYVAPLFAHFLNQPVAFEDVQSFAIPDARILDPLFKTEASLRRSLPSLLHFSQKGRTPMEHLTPLLENVLRRCLSFQASDLIMNELDLIERTIKDDSLRKEIAKLAIQRYLSVHRGGYRWFRYVDSIESASEILFVYRMHDPKWQYNPEAVRALMDIIRFLAKHSVVDENCKANLHLSKTLALLVCQSSELRNVEAHPELLYLFTLYSHHRTWPQEAHAKILLIIAIIAPESTARLAFIEIVRLLSCGLILSPEKWLVLVPLQYRFKDIPLPPILTLIESLTEPNWEEVKEQYFNVECLIRFIRQEHVTPDELIRQEDLACLLGWAKKNGHLQAYPEIYADIIALEVLRNLPGSKPDAKLTFAVPDFSMGIILYFVELIMEPELTVHPLAILRDRLLANTCYVKFEMILQMLCQITVNQFKIKHKNQARFERDFKELMHALFAHPHFRLEKHLVTSMKTGLTLFKNPTDIFFYNLFLRDDLNDKRVVDAISMTHSQEDMYALLTRAIDLAHRRLDYIGFFWSHFIVIHITRNFPKNKSRVQPFLTKILTHLRHRHTTTEEFETALATAFDDDHFTPGMQSWLRNFIDRNDKEPLPPLTPLTAKDFE